MGLFDSLFDTGYKDAYRQNVANLEFIKSLFGKPGTTNPNKVFGAISQAFGIGNPLMQEAVDRTIGGFGRAETIAGTGESDMAQTIVDRGLQAAASARSRLAGLGLYATTGSQAPLATMDYLTNRALSGNAAAFAGQRGQYAAQGGTAAAQALTNQAQFALQRPQMMQSAAQGLGGLVSQYQFSPGASLFQQLGGPLGFFLGNSGLFGGGGRDRRTPFSEYTSRGGQVTGPGAAESNYDPNYNYGIG